MVTRSFEDYYGDPERQIVAHVSHPIAIQETRQTEALRLRFRLPVRNYSLLQSDLAHTTDMSTSKRFGSLPWRVILTV